MMTNLFIFQESKYDVKRLCKLTNYGGGGWLSVSGLFPAIMFVFPELPILPAMPHNVACSHYFSPNPHAI